MLAKRIPAGTLAGAGEEGCSRSWLARRTAVDDGQRVAWLELMLEAVDSAEDANVRTALHGFFAVADAHVVGATESAVAGLSIASSKLFRPNRGPSNARIA